jgi:hypothetical protein
LGINHFKTLYKAREESSIAEITKVAQLFPRFVEDKYFDYEDVKEDKKVKQDVTRLKGHATLWWDELQADRRCKGKQKIKRWDRMVAKMKSKFIPKDYQITMFQRMQNFREKMMSMKEYTE